MLTDNNELDFHRRRLLARFWASAAGFWRGPAARTVWALCTVAVGIVIAQLAIQYLLNYWNRDFFNALERKDRSVLADIILLFFPLAAASIVLAIASIWARMTIQRRWRRHLAQHLIERWLDRDRYKSLGHLNGTDTPRNIEYRIAEDARVATDAPVELTLSLLSSILTTVIFFDVLSSVGGAITVSVQGWMVTIPAYLAIAVVVYSSVVTTAVLLIGRRLTSVVQDQMQAEAAFRAAANLIRESGDGTLDREITASEHQDLWVGLRNVIAQWRRYCGQVMRVTFVGHTNYLLAPVVGLLLCAPKYLSAELTLGEVTQTAAAFATVQGAFNWFVDNFQRMSDWRSSVNRIAAFLIALDELK